MVFMQREKLGRKRIETPKQKELLGCFSEDIKMWPSHNVLNW